MIVNGYTETGMISITRDGATMFVPDDPKNADRREIAAWEALGNTIPPYVAAVDLPAYAARKRRAVRDAGCVVTVAGTPIPVWADADSCGAITSLVVAAQLNPSITTGWKGRNGAFYPLDAAKIQALALGMLAFVDACFAKEAELLAGIVGATITSTAQIDAAAWPSNS